MPDDPDSPSERWRRGPDADNPPWAGRDRDDDQGQAQEESEPPAPDPDPDHDEGERGAGQAAGGPGSELTTLPPGMAPPRPPRRTGVFLDPADLRVHVGDLLRAILGGYQVDAWGNFTFTHEQARVFVTVGVTPMGPQVGVFSITNVEVPFTETLARFLLANNHRLAFGSFSYDDDNRAVWLRHSVLGATLDAPELQSAVVAIASAAAHFEPIIRERFGGRAFHDVPEHQQRQTKPPETPDQPYPTGASGYL